MKNNFATAVEAGKVEGDASVTVRKHLDQYYTPQKVADALVAHYLTRFPKPDFVIEPSVGKGAWSRAINEQAQPKHILGIDLEDHSEGSLFCDNQFLNRDFLQYDPIATGLPVDLVIGNPPYSEALAHAEHALSLVQNGGRVAFLLRLAFMETAARAPFWAANKPRLVTVLAQRPSFTGKGTDSAAYGFFVWEKGFNGPSEIVPGFDWRSA